jgi:hypothetical protein
VLGTSPVNGGGKPPAVRVPIQRDGIYLG